MMFVQSFVFIIVAVKGIQGSRVIEVGGVQTVLAVVNEDVEISCKEDISMSYCGFTHPNGTRFSYAGGANLNSGHCSLKLKVVRSDSGKWTCHIGRKGYAGEELAQTKYIRVADKLAAVEPNVLAARGSEATLTCTTPYDNAALSYCRFVPPKGKPFSIDASITRNNSIRGRFYFPTNKSVDRGDCAVNIVGISDDDVGSWLCGAWLELDSKEYVDFIQLSLPGEYSLSTASVTGIVIGGFAVVLALALGVLATRRRAGSVAAAPGDGVELQRMRSRSGTPQPPAPRVRVEPPSDGSSALLREGGVD